MISINKNKFSPIRNCVYIFARLFASVVLKIVRLAQLVLSANLVLSYWCSLILLIFLADFRKNPNTQIPKILKRIRLIRVVPSTFVIGCLLPLPHSDFVSLVASEHGSDSVLRDNNGFQQ